jgi:hypothetical protein
VLTPYLVSQTFALAALVTGIYAFFKASDQHLKLMIGAQAVLMAAHFALLGAWAGAALALWGAARYGVSAYTRHSTLFWLFLGGGTALGLWRYTTPSDILPILANAIACVAIFRLQGTPMRQTLLLTSVCWLAYNLLHASVVGSLVESFYLASNLYTLVEMRRRRTR